MNAQEFIAKWRRVQLTERSASQQHFLDLCELLGHEKPAAADPDGTSFTFERGAKKLGGEDGWADVWKKGFFGWEYKGKHKDLDKAYGQLLLYREDLENPPLLVVCDMDRIVVHTNFTSTPTRVHELHLDDLTTPRALEILHAVFFEPDKLKPGITSRVVTEEAARHIGEIAQTLRDRGFEGETVAHFLDRLVFCMFAEDVGLLPEKLFSRLVEKSRRDPTRFTKLVTDLFTVMANGGDFGADTVRHFDGNLFNDASALPLTEDEVERIHKAALLDWSTVEPDIFGTLFERGLDPDKRSQIGAHYTSREDIETLVEPVVMQPLRREWDDVRAMVLNVLATGKKHPSHVGAGLAPARLSPAALRKAHDEGDTLLQRFMGRLAQVKVLDPACGSGNFLYVTLQKLKELEQEVSSFAAENGFGGLLPIVGPWQLHGIEINRYACELAQLVVWIGYLQWLVRHGYPVPDKPVLQPMDTIQCRDAILDLSDPQHPKEPDWPAVDFIVSNPPFLGGSRLWERLGRAYQHALWKEYHGRVPGFADLCCYWFEKARKQIEEGKCQRAGLLATQAIRGGASREVLKRIKQTGDIFFAVSDRDWVLDGAHVHISIVAFDDGSETARVLDGVSVPETYANLSAAADIVQARGLSANAGIAFIGTKKAGRFDVEEPVALEWLYQPNPNGRPSSDILRPWLNGGGISKEPCFFWIVDPGTEMTVGELARYALPFSHLLVTVKPARDRNKRAVRRERWWLHAETAPAMRRALAALPRFIATPRVSKHRVFIWVDPVTLCDDGVFVFARDDDYFFGVLHSRVHEVWALRMGTRLETRPRYTPTTCFDTFPFPWSPGQESQDDPRVQAIAEAARELNELRERWLNPAEWVREGVLEFPGSVDGPWARYVHDSDARGIGTVRYPRLVAKDAECAAKLKARTLTNLYNQRPAWLALAHEKLDAAVFAAYGWNPSMSDDQLLESLLALNLQRAGTAEADLG